MPSWGRIAVVVAALIACAPARAAELACADGLDDDADGVSDCADRDCVADPACALQDADGDGAANAIDCSPFDDQVFAPPPDVVLRATRVASTDTRLAWTDVAPLAGAGTTSDVVTGALGVLQSTRGVPTDVAVLATGLRATTIDDAAPFSPADWRDARWYLVRAVNACGVGDFGLDALDPTTPELDCTNGIDDDANLLADCADPACAMTPACCGPCAQPVSIPAPTLSCQTVPGIVDACGIASFDVVLPAGVVTELATCGACGGSSTFASTLELRDPACAPLPDAPTACAPGATIATTRAGPVTVVVSAAGIGGSFVLAWRIIDEGDCADGLDNDGDGLTDCADPACAGACPEVDCADGVDNDLDGRTDCADTDCNLACPESRCSNGIDDDGNGLTDCADPACATVCPEVNCSDGLDDDADGLTDCADTDCNLVCPESACLNGLDDDANGFTDCDDPACATTPTCCAPCSHPTPIPPPTAACQTVTGVVGPCGVTAFRTTLPPGALVELSTCAAACGGDADFPSTIDIRWPTCDYQVGSTGPQACGLGAILDTTYSGDRIIVVRAVGAPATGAFTLGYRIASERECGNGRDDDGDGLTDCADADCAQTTNCPEIDCGNGFDDDGDGLTDCADPGCLLRCREDCDDGVDNDQDGAFDCADSDCSCSESNCINGADDDLDGATDCADPDCAFSGPCAERSCTDATDNDGDGLTDCQDPDCANQMQWCAPCGGGTPIDSPTPICRRQPWGTCPTCANDLLAVHLTKDIAVSISTGSCGPCQGTAAFTNLFLMAWDPQCRIVASNHDCVGLSGDAWIQFVPAMTGVYQIGIEDEFEGRLTPGSIGIVIPDELLCNDGADNDGDLLIDCLDPACARDTACRETACSNGLDDDGNGLIDCRDPGCTGRNPCIERNCTNGLDDEGDLLIDCADSDCRNDAGCFEHDCSGATDTDGDGLFACADPDCHAQWPCHEGWCLNGIDDDGDGLVDCIDPDCDGDPDCHETSCTNGVDEDADGATDCADVDCRNDVSCPESDCGNGLDDDGDGATDCADSGCVTTRPCAESACFDGLDDDGDALIDCADPDCNGQLGCHEFDCLDGLDDDGDTLIDCADEDCAQGSDCCGACRASEILLPPATSACQSIAGSNPAPCRSRFYALDMARDECVVFTLCPSECGSAVPGSSLDVSSRDCDLPVAADDGSCPPEPRLVYTQRYFAGRVTLEVVTTGDYVLGWHHCP